MFAPAELDELEEFTGLTALTATIAALDEHLLADDDLLAGVASIEAARRFLDAAEGSMLAELDARGTTDIVCGLRTAGWLARETGMSPVAAKSRVKVATTLRLDLPGTDRAVREGRLCADRARVMAGVVNERNLDEFREMEDALIDESASMTFEKWAQRVRLVAALLDQDGPEPADDVANNKLALRGAGDELRITATFVGSFAVTTREAIEQVADELYRQYRDDSERTAGEIAVPSRATLLALAHAELCRRGLMVNRKGNGTKPRVEATLVINADAPDVVYVDGVPLVKGSSEALWCDMSVWEILIDHLGLPVDMGREIRSANREQRRALKQRDGGCVFPGCDVRPRHCDAHHVAEWYRDLGTTDVKYMAYLCRHHHGVVHRKGWSIQIGDDGWCWLTTPSGISLWCQRHGTVRSGAPPPG